MATHFTAAFLAFFQETSRKLCVASLVALAITVMPAANAEAATKKQAKPLQASSAKASRASKPAVKSSKVKAAGKLQRVVVMKNGKRVVMMRRVPVVAAVPPRPACWAN